ncbi:MAG: hypothetical protein ACSHX6_05760 [Akkermansiaceae bacterium]
MAEKLTVPEPNTIHAATPITSLPDDQEKLHATLEERIYTIVGKELLGKDYRPTAYAEAVLMSAGDENHIIYNYAKIRYKELYATASRRLKHSSELRG